MKKTLLALAACLSILNAEPKRLIVLDPAIVEMLYMMDAQENITAISTLQFATIWPEEETKKLKSVGTYSKPNIEKIVELKPDMLIGSFYSTNIGDDIKKFNIPTKELKADSVDDIYENIREVGKIVGKEQKAEEIIAGIEERIAKFESSPLKGKKAVIIFSSTPPTAFSSNTLAGDLLKRLGLINIADKTDGKTPIVSSEYMLVQNPDFIIVISGMGEKNDFLAQNPVLKKTTAAKNNKVLKIPASILLRGTPRIGEAIDQIYKMMSE